MQDLGHVSGILALEEVLPVIGTEGKVTLAGKQVQVHFTRLRLYKEKGCDCVSCGAKGSFFAVETHLTTDQGWVVNLYAERADGSYVMMTNDHIIPKSKGGNDLLINRQPMCKKCNAKKNDDMPEEHSRNPWLFTVS